MSITRIQLIGLQSFFLTRIIIYNNMSKIVSYKISELDNKILHQQNTCIKLFHISSNEKNLRGVTC